MKIQFISKTLFQKAVKLLKKKFKLLNCPHCSTFALIICRDSARCATNHVIGIGKVTMHLC